MPMVPDDEFKLRLPVAKDLALRRIAIAQLIIYMVSLSSVALFLSAAIYNACITGADRNHSDENAIIASVIAAFFFALSFPASWIVSIIEARVLIRRYGWRAVSDPIEAQRIAMREALYDVATGSAQVMPDQDEDRIIVVPARRLRPIGARLELTAERDKAQAQHKTR